MSKLLNLMVLVFVSSSTIASLEPTKTPEYWTFTERVHAVGSDEDFMENALLSEARGATSAANKEIIHEFLPDPEGIGIGEYTGISADIDQDTMILGSAGYAVIFELENGDWIEKSILRPPYEYAEFFGKFVAIQGDIALVGAPDGHGYSNQSGVVYVFRKVANDWSLEQIISANSNQSSNDFGDSLAFSGDQLVIGDSNSDEYGYDSGAVFVYEYVIDQWVQAQALSYTIEPQSQNYLSFGKSLAANQNTLLVGATGYDNNSGIVYVFTINQGVWIQSQTIQAADSIDDLHFGRQIALDDTDLVISALRHNALSTGKLYFFESINGVWTEQSDFIPPTPVYEEFLGTSLSINGNVLVAGAYGNEDMGDERGAAYVFEKLQTGWQFEQKIYDPDLKGKFGYTVRAHENHVLVSNGLSQTYTFENTNNSWMSDHKVELNPGAYNHWFANILDIDGDVAAFSALDYSRSAAGDDVYQPSLYVFEKGSNDQWTLSFKQIYDSPDYYFGRAVHVKDETVLFFNESQLFIWEKDVNGWHSSQGFDLPFLINSQQSGTGFVKMLKMLKTENDIISMSYDGINNKILIYQIEIVNNQLVVQELSAFESESQTLLKGMAYIDGLLYLPNVSSGTDPQDYVSIMTYGNSGWVEQSTLVSPVVGDNQNFGSAFSASHNLLAVGAANTQFDQQGWTVYRGEVHLYKQSQIGWEYLETLHTFDSSLEDYGLDLYLNDETLIVSARSLTGNDFKLLDYEYINGWQNNGFLASGYGQNDEFGQAFKGQDNHLLVGMPRAGFYGINSGRATLYKLNETFSVSGGISNLLPQNSLKLKLNDREVISINGNFTFDMELPTAHNYTIEIIGNAYPITQSCQVTDGSGTIQQQNIVDINIICDDFVDLIFENSFD